MILDKKISDILKGFFAYCVLLHHVYQYSGMFRGTIVGGVLQSLGYLSVSFFMFASGYGLMQQYIGRDDYLRGFIFKRCIPVYAVYVFVILVYSCFLLMAGTDVSWGGVCNHFCLVELL